MEQRYIIISTFREYVALRIFRVRDSSEQIPAVRLVDDDYFYFSDERGGRATAQNLVRLEQFFGSISEKFNESLETEIRAHIFLLLRTKVPRY